MPKHKKNPFIVIESNDAGGSSTQTKLLVRKLKSVGLTPLSLHFPQASRASGQIIYEKYLRDFGRHPFSKREQVLLYIMDMFSRAEDIQGVINGQSTADVVVTDRYFTSTLAYQSAGLTGAQRKRILLWINWLCCENKPQLPRPSHIIFLDTPLSLSLKRLTGRVRDMHETKEKLKVFRASYLRLAKEQGWTQVSSVGQNGVERTRQDIHKEIWEKIRSGLKL